MAETGDNLFHIFIDLKERAPVNMFDKYISPYLSVEYVADILTRKKSAESIAKDVDKLIEPFKKLKEGNRLVYEELVVKVPGAGVVASDIEISLSGENENEILNGVKYLRSSLEKINGFSILAPAIVSKPLPLAIITRVLTIGSS